MPRHAMEFQLVVEVLPHELAARDTQPVVCRYAREGKWRVAEHEDFVALAQRPFVDAAGRDQAALALERAPGISSSPWNIRAACFS
jgi:hypothetical protein